MQSNSSGEISSSKAVLVDSTNPVIAKLIVSAQRKPDW
jgi:hypothetical protein